MSLSKRIAEVKKRKRKRLGRVHKRTQLRARLKDKK